MQPPLGALAEKSSRWHGPKVQLLPKTQESLGMPLAVPNCHFNVALDATSGALWEINMAARPS